VLLGLSHGGRSRATVEALAAAREAGALTALVTADPGAPAAQTAAHCLVTPLRDASFCHTVAYVSAILAGAAVAASIAGGRPEATPIRSHLEELLAEHAQADAVAASLHGSRHVLCVGGGTDFVAARELALKLEEAARLPATALGLEAVLHGHLVATDATTALVLLLTDPRSSDRRLDRGLAVLRAARRIGVRTAAIATSEHSASIGPELASAGLIVVPDAPGLSATLSSLLSTALSLQQLTLGLVHEAGVNPDLIRREEQPYREAAELAEAKVR
jgi:fructoselysine-6-P-deglycase FrlB-like protein